ncbi:hypothetical protein ACIOEW_28085 [Streptomyces sp. NPDC087901]|uniref:hypothetical protein n=1 Tax=Streptomyces sp. NPDC087901 TaxID=3365818 RepID=UPI003816AC34
MTAPSSAPLGSSCSRQADTPGSAGGALPALGSAAQEQGCLSVLASPSCFGFLLFVCLWIGVVAWHDLAI